MESSELARRRMQATYQVVVSACLVVAGIYLIRVALDLPDPSLPGSLGPAALPVAALSALIAAGLWLLGGGIRSLNGVRREAAGAPDGVKEPPRVPGERLKVVAVLASLFAYAWIWHRVGFPVTSVVFVSLASALLTPPEKRSWPKSIAFGLVVTGAIYGLFNGLLELPLPAWPWS